MQKLLKLVLLMVAAIGYVNSYPWNDNNRRPALTLPKMPIPTTPPFNPGPYRPPFGPSPTFPHIPIPTTPPFNPGSHSPPVWRVRRSPQGGLEATIIKPEHMRPQFNLDYNQKFINNDREKFGAYGGVNSQDFKHFHPHGGLNYEWTPNRDTSFRAHGGVQQMPGGHFAPNLGLTFERRFRRDVDEEEYVEDE